MEKISPEQLWLKFEHSGKIQDYLNYKTAAKDTVDTAGGNQTLSTSSEVAGPHGQQNPGTYS